MAALAETIAQFRAGLAARDLEPDEVVADGSLQRCPVRGARPGREDGCYILHPDGVPAGGFENHRDGLGWQTWRAHMPARKLTQAERDADRDRIATQRAAREMDLAERHRAAAARAASLWQRARPAASTHPYLIKKGVPAYGLRQLRDALVIPARDADGTLWTLEFIAADGTKKFLTGGRKRGCYFAIGRPDRVLCVAEGYATAASIHMATGHAVAVAFDAGNLAPVALALRAKFPAVQIIVAADDDTTTAGNPGITDATKAARAVGGLLAVPRFGLAVA